MYKWNGHFPVVVQPTEEQKEKLIRDFKECKSHGARPPVLESEPLWKPMSGVMTQLSKHIVFTYLTLSSFGLWDDSMRRAVISAKYKESQKWAKSS